MYSTLMAAFSRAASTCAEPPGRSGTSTAKTSVSLTAKPAASNSSLASSQRRHDEPQDAVMLRIGQREGDDVDVPLGQHLAGRPAAGPACSHEDRKLMHLHAMLSFSKVSE